ncbi:hypothetical protein Bca52824_036155 [Brassica carinata]|uniref:BHLH domain-containing protein n=1 Tax=Brassica carinata TaxID=52824 RepID=A0A8X7S4S0_BRACI|nr:hypothetical protein Bca52824_036155 [Brassica carinata]
MIGVGKTKHYSNVLDRPLSKGKQEDAGYAVGARVLELLCNQTRLLGILSFVHSTVWKVLFGKVVDSLEKGTEHEDEYMIIDQHGNTFNCGAFVAGIVKVRSSGYAGFPAVVTAHFVPIEGQQRPRTTILIKFADEESGGPSQDGLHGQGTVSTTSAPVARQKPRVRARRGQATDPHSIAERLRRERIAERMKSLQELVPNTNKVYNTFLFCINNSCLDLLNNRYWSIQTDKASMLDEIIEYVRFLQLQVKVLSVSRLGGARAAGGPGFNGLTSEAGGRLNALSGPSNGVNGNGNASGSSNESLRSTEKRVAKLMEEDMGSAMQYLQGKGLCLMPISLATAISSSTTSNHSRGALFNPSSSVVAAEGANVAAAAAPKASTSMDDDVSASKT